jgi:GNAT superfamily N-acetyltransferase
VIRAARAEDIPSLRAMMSSSNGYRDPAARDMIVRYAGTWTPEEDACVRVFDDGGGAAGFYQLIPHAEGLELDLFFTSDARQGRGLGRRLFEDMAVTARALGARRVVIVSNPPAADFYRRMGARDVGVQAPSATIIWERPRLVVEL